MYRTEIQFLHKFIGRSNIGLTGHYMDIDSHCAHGPPAQAQGPTKQHGSSDTERTCQKQVHIQRYTNLVTIILVLLLYLSFKM
jgi:hypothetical protein